MSDHTGADGEGQGAASSRPGLSQVDPLRVSPPEGASIPSADDEERKPSLKWIWKDHWSGESATFEVCGLRAYVKDYDGDWSGWNIRKGKKGPVVAHGVRFDLHGAVFAAEDALRKIVADRIAELRAGRSALAQGGETRRAETAQAGSVHEHPVAEGQAPDPSEIPTLKAEIGRLRSRLEFETRAAKVAQSALAESERKRVEAEEALNNYQQCVALLVRERGPSKSSDIHPRKLLGSTPTQETFHVES